MGNIGSIGQDGHEDDSSHHPRYRVVEHEIELRPRAIQSPEPDSRLNHQEASETKG